MLKEYIEKDIELSKKEMIIIFGFLFVASGIFGWLYEFIFYFFNSGMKTFYLQGSNFLPWINIYMYGAFLIIFLTYKRRKHPLQVFLISMISTGILEYLTGYILYGILGWTKCWDYNQEILNFGNINGYVCLRSVLVFGLCGLILIYGMLPICIKLVKTFNQKALLVISMTLFSIFLIDDLYNLCIDQYVPLPGAVEFYQTKGFKYQYFYDK